jgi:hypothetical protein
MKPLPHSPDLLEVAPRIIWFEPAEAALANPVRLLTYLMARGTIEEIKIVRRYVSLDDFREALEHAPPGVIDTVRGPTGIQSLGAIRPPSCRSETSMSDNRYAAP